MKASRQFIFILLSFYLLTSCSQKKEEQNSISNQKLYEITSMLASEKFNGRLAGSEGYNRAAEYVAKHFQSAGLKEMSYLNYFQNFSVEYNDIQDLYFSKITDKAKELAYEPGKDFVCRGFSGSGDIKSSVVFCGYGISKPESGYDDYEGIDVHNKIVMIFKYDPRWKLNSEKIGYNSLRKKAAAAKEHGASGIIYISSPAGSNPQEPIGSVLHGDGKQLEDMPQIHISLNVAEDFFENTNQTLKELQKIIDKEKHPESIMLKTKAHIKVKATFYKEKNTMNVVGLLEGNDPILKNEYVVLGAHLDHVGNQGDKVLFPGANDNASGVASVISIAKALSNEKNELKRSVIFVAFSSEEQGLQGASHFVKNSPVPHEKIVAMLNMDCVAHGDSIVLGGGKSFPALYKLGRKKDSLNRSLVINRTWGGGGADATPFYEKNIPTLYFATKNSYTHLHLPSDKPETMNKDLHKAITELAYQITKRIAKGNYSKETEE